MFFHMSNARQLSTTNSNHSFNSLVSKNDVLYCHSQAALASHNHSLHAHSVTIYLFEYFDLSSRSKSQNPKKCHSIENLSQYFQRANLLG